MMIVNLLEIDSNRLMHLIFYGLLGFDQSKFEYNNFINIKVHKINFGFHFNRTSVNFHFLSILSYESYANFLYDFFDINKVTGNSYIVYIV